MPKRSSKSKRRSKALPALGFAGVSFSMASGACASTSEATANTTSQRHEIFLGEEEISDVSLATFYVFDKENAGAPPLAQRQRLAFGGCRCGGGCGGCRCGGGCGGCAGIGGGVRVVCAGGCAGWGGGCRACRCGGFFFRGCVGCVACGGCGGCGGSCLIWTPTWGWVYSCWGGSAPAGEASPVASEQIEQTAEASGRGDEIISAARTK
jgi:hypothetical protein